MSSEKTCFIISPIGEPESEIRKLADEKYDLIFEPVLKELGYTPIRSDKENTSNSISRTIVTRLINSELVIADTSGFNANVFYELAIRNASKKPVIIIKEFEQKLPFDIYDKRAISIDMKNNRQWTTAKEELKQHITNAIKDPKSASESILSEYTFDLGVSKSPNTEQEMFLTIKDLKDEIRNIRNDIRSPSRSSLESSTDLSKGANFRLKNKRLSKNDMLHLMWNSGMFNDKDEMRVDVTDPKGNDKNVRNQILTPNTVGLSFNVKQFMTENGLYFIRVYVNDVLEFIDSFQII